MLIVEIMRLGWENTLEVSKSPDITYIYIFSYGAKMVSQCASYHFEVGIANKVTEAWWVRKKQVPITQSWDL